MTDLPKTPSFSLAGRKALVAGATSGIGLGCAVALAESGAQVVLAARSEAGLIKTRDKMLASGFDVSVLPFDINNVTATADAVSEHGPFDILVNSAGTARHSASVDTTEADFDAVMGVNLRGAYFLTQAVAKGLLKAGKPGSLINISSQMSVVGGIERAVYCASKHGVDGFTKAMAIELGPFGIRVNTINPTFVRTPLSAPSFENPERLAWIEEKIKMGRVGEIEDIMGVVVYLASDAASLVTGTALMVDGGWTAD